MSPRKYWIKLIHKLIVFKNKSSKSNKEIKKTMFKNTNKKKIKVIIILWKKWVVITIYFLKIIIIIDPIEN